MPKKCRLCNQQVSDGTTHYCPNRSGLPILEGDGDAGGDFLLSMAVAAATDSAIIGVIAGGDVTGAIVGDLLVDGDLDLFDGLGDLFD